MDEWRGGGEGGVAIAKGEMGGREGGKKRREGGGIDGWKEEGMDGWMGGVGGWGFWGCVGVGVGVGVGGGGFSRLDFMNECIPACGVREA